MEETRQEPAPGGRGDFGGYAGPLDAGPRATFGRIDGDLMAALGRLKAAIAEFDCARHAWAEIEANDAPPGRGSELVGRLEVMQGHALGMLDGAAMGLRARIRGQEPGATEARAERIERALRWALGHLDRLVSGRGDGSAWAGGVELAGYAAGRSEADAALEVSGPIRRSRHGHPSPCATRVGRGADGLAFVVYLSDGTKVSVGRDPSTRGRAWLEIGPQARIAAAGGQPDPATRAPDAAIEAAPWPGMPGQSDPGPLRPQKGAAP